MRLEQLSTEAQEGLRLWAVAVHNDELMLDAISSLPEQWTWIWFQLREADDRPDWFPHGKWATIQFIEQLLVEEAQSHGSQEFKPRTKKPRIQTETGRRG